ncbi:MAG: hypothetical protein GYA57_07600, partial [Myxococcales bacterium]|nr:hypothetical protein [Myxococcales bacterium]
MDHPGVLGDGQDIAEELGQGTELVQQDGGEQGDVATELREDLASAVEGSATVHVSAEV